MFNPLRYFVEVARAGSLRGAAERLHVAASAIGRQVKIFEDDAGTPLFERHARGMALTAAGDIYLRYAQSVLAEAESTQLEIDSLRGLKRGNIRIVSIEGVIAGPLFRAMKAFRNKFPDVRFSVTAAETHSVLPAVRDGQADIGIAFQSLAVAGAHIVRRLTAPLFLICSPQHPLARSNKTTLQELVRYPLALPDRTFGIRHIMDAACHVHRLRPTISLETNSVEALRLFARNGLGATILPAVVARADIDAKTVVASSITNRAFAEPSFDIGVREGRVLPGLAKVFLDELVQEFEKNSEAMHAKQTVAVRSAKGRRAAKSR